MFDLVFQCGDIAICITRLRSTGHGNTQGYLRFRWTSGLRFLPVIKSITCMYTSNVNQLTCMCNFCDFVCSSYIHSGAFWAHHILFFCVSMIDKKEFHTRRKKWHRPSTTCITGSIHTTLLPHYRIAITGTGCGSRRHGIGVESGRLIVIGEIRLSRR